MSKDTKNVEAAWKAAQASYVTEVKDGKATVEKIPIRPQGNGPVTSREQYIKSLEMQNQVCAQRHVHHDGDDAEPR